MNPPLQLKYLTKLNDMEGKRRHGCSYISELAHLKLPLNSHSVDLNEHFLFHGAPPSTLENICKGGFNPHGGGEETGKMFGGGSYFAVNSTKADDTTEDHAKPLAKRARRTLVVARVALGEAARVLHPVSVATRSPDGQDCLEHDAVWADSKANGGCVDHIEVVIYSEGQALPVALVDYEHQEGCQCAFCRRRPA